MSTTAGGSDSVIIALHGFLGLPDDWAPFRDAFALPEASREPSRAFQARSLWADLRLISPRFQAHAGTDLGSLFSPHASLAFDLWAQEFLKEIEKRNRATGERPIVMGYSLGGRLLMHAVAARAELFRGCILISANPGLPSMEAVGPEAREARFQQDHLWSERFLNGEWDETVEAWNAQSVFTSSGQSIGQPRRERDFDRILLGDALTLWSLARQRDLRDLALRVPTQLITGELDRKFTDLTADWLGRAPMGGSLGSHQGSQPSAPPGSHPGPSPASQAGASVTHAVIAGAGHRVPWDQPGAFISEVQRWLATLSEDNSGQH